MELLNRWLADTSYLLGVDFVHQALLACALLGVLSGVMAPLIVLRSMSFSVHATSELALMGAAAALLAGANIGLGAIAGAMCAAVVLAVLGFRGQQDSAIGVVMSFGLGLSVLFIHLYPGNSTTAMSLLTGQIVGVSGASVGILAATTAGVVAAVALLWRPLLFASADPLLAQAAGVKVRTLSIIFAVLVGLAAAQSVQIVGVLLVMALLITPGAAAVALSAHPPTTIALSVLFAELSAVGGLIISLGPGIPVSVGVTTVSFIIYLVARAIAAGRSRHLSASTPAGEEPDCAHPHSAH